MQLLGPKAQDGGKIVQAAVSGVVALLEALEAVMQPANYLAALLQLLQSPTSALVPRVVRLFESSLSKATDAPAVDAAMQFCQQVL